MIRLFIVILFVMCLLLPVWSVLDLLDDYEKYRSDYPTWIYVLRLLQICAGFIPIYLIYNYRFLKRKIIFTSSSQGLWLRLFLAAIFLALAVTTVFSSMGLIPDNRDIHQSFFNTILMMMLSCWCIYILYASDGSFFSSGILKGLDVVAFNLFLTLIIAEFSLTLVSRVFPNPLLWDQNSIQTRILAHKLEPRIRFFNTYINSAGYHDEEFFTARENDLVIALLSDSFGVGVVPHEYNFSTVAEKKLQTRLGKKYNRIAIHNFGIPGIGVAEYAYLMENEVAQYSPDKIIVAIFIGNDLIDSKFLKKNYYNLGDWKVVQLPKRVMTLLRETKTTKGSGVALIGESMDSDTSIPDYIFDWRKENPSMTRSKFIENELLRLEICNTEDESNEALYSRVFSLIDHLKSLANEDLVFLLIPDEFQVNDALYTELIGLKDGPEHYDRELPQKKLSQYFKSHGIMYVDLLDAIREAEKKERTYHLQDTHWNARGNKIAGQAIADFLLEPGILHNQQ